jgi:hypothetical protein
MITLRQHRKLQTEARDEAWATGVEADIRSLVKNDLIAQGLDTHRVELPVLECRTTGCEVQAIAHREDFKLGNDLQFTMLKMYTGARGEELDRSRALVHFSELPEGRLAYIFFVWRRAP